MSQIEWCIHLQAYVREIAPSLHSFKAAFHDTDIDTDTDSPDTPISFRPIRAISSQGSSRGIGRVDVGVVECGLYGAWHSSVNSFFLLLTAGYQLFVLEGTRRAPLRRTFAGRRTWRVSDNLLTLYRRRDASRYFAVVDRRVAMRSCSSRCLSPLTGLCRVIA